MAKLSLFKKACCFPNENMKRPKWGLGIPDHVEILPTVHTINILFIQIDIN